VDFSAIRTQISYADVCHPHCELKAMKIASIALTHPNQGTGFKFAEYSRSFVFLTDNELGYRQEGGLGYSEYMEFCRGANRLIHDARYKESEYKKPVAGVTPEGIAFRLFKPATPGTANFYRWSHPQKKSHG